jgi:hypothetical protein
MKWTIEYLEEDKIIYLKASGILNGEEIRQMAIEIAQAMVEHEAHLILSNCTEMIPDITKLDIDELPRIMSQNGFTRKDKHALVININSEKLDNFAFYKASSKVQNYRVKLFTDIDTAKEWLKQMEYAGIWR